MYEEPIVQSREPTATVEEKEIGETRANEVFCTCHMSSMLHRVNDSLFLPARCVRSARPAGTKIALHFCACVCVCVCLPLSHALNDVIPLLCHYSHERGGNFCRVNRPRYAKLG